MLSKRERGNFRKSNPTTTTVAVMVPAMIFLIEKIDFSTNLLIALLLLEILDYFRLRHYVRMAHIDRCEG